MSTPDKQTAAPNLAEADYPRASFMRRLAAMIYDALVAVAIAMLSGLLMSVILAALYSNGLVGQAYPEYLVYSQESLSFKLIMNSWVIFWVVAFFMWFWAKGGQTIGMRAWRLRLFSSISEPVSFTRLLVRLLTSLCGFGTVLVLFDRKHKLALQDRASQMEMLVLTKGANDHKNWQ